ncbi:MAG: hypothetical protein HQL41_14395, partial [Alphaproteobacteria bacterium]|nr:hypothetical protein [Alphaproteobacteria bacterium]
GYLFGVAAECALKHIMFDSGMRPSGVRRDDPFFAHFEELKTLLRDTAAGRRASELLRYANDQGLMQHWDTDMRYSHGNDIESKWIEKWRGHAKDLVERMDG